MCDVDEGEREMERKRTQHIDMWEALFLVGSFFRCRSERGSCSAREPTPAYSNQVSLSVMGKGRKCARGYTLQSGPEGPSWCREESVWAVSELPCTKFGEIGLQVYSIQLVYGPNRNV